MKSKQKIRIDYNRAQGVFDRLIEALRTRQFPFNRNLDIVPQRAFDLFERGSDEHICFLFCLCYHMRGGIKSNVAVDQYLRMFKEHPEFFRTKTFDVSDDEVDLLAEQVTVALLKHRFQFLATQTGKMWVANFRKMHRHWGGNPVALFWGTTTYSEVCKRFISNRGKKDPHNPFGFLGFREKMVSMLWYFYITGGILDRAHFPVPVDFHVLRILASHEILTAGKFVPGKDIFNASLLPQARKVTAWYSKKSNVDPIDLADVLWNLSRDLCARHPGNESVTPEGNKSRSLTIIPAKVRWTKGQVHRYEHTCGRCPIRKTCTYNIPSSEYYFAGKLILRSKRKIPSQGNLFREG